MKRDVTGRAVEKASGVAGRVLARLHDAMPLGPSRVQMSPRELRRAVRDMKGDSLLRLLDVLGEERVTELIRESKNG